MGTHRISFFTWRILFFWRKRPPFSLPSSLPSAGHISFLRSSSSSFVLLLVWLLFPPLLLLFLPISRKCPLLFLQGVYVHGRAAKKKDFQFCPKKKEKRTKGRKILLSPPLPTSNGRPSFFFRRGASFVERADGDTTQD